MAAKFNKQPKAAFTPHPEKLPHAQAVLNGPPWAWRFAIADKGGPFAWTPVTENPELLSQIIDRLTAIESKNWNELCQTGSHPIAIWKLTKEARDRLEELQQNDIDDLVSFRINSTGRVWCIKENNTFKILWWDPDHRVYVVEKKNT